MNRLLSIRRLAAALFVLLAWTAINPWLSFDRAPAPHESSSAAATRIEGLHRALEDAPGGPIAEALGHRPATDLQCHEDLGDYSEDVLRFLPHLTPREASAVIPFGGHVQLLDLKPTIIAATFVDVAGGQTIIEGTNFVGVPGVVATINSVDYALTGVSTSGGGTLLTATLPTPGPYTAGGWTLKVSNPGGQSATLSGSGAGVCTTGFVVFAPSCLSGNKFDFDSATTVTCGGGAPTDGCLVDQWIDVTGAITATASGSARGTYHTNCQNGFPCVTGETGTTWLTTGNVTWSSKIATVCAVLKVPVSSNNSVIYEATNAARTAAVNGFTLQYQTNGPQFDVSTGSSGNSTLNETLAITGPDVNTNYRVACFVHDRTATYPITIITGQPVQEKSFYAGARAGQNYITAQTSASNFDTAPFSFFARNTSGAAGSPSKTSYLRLFAYNVALSDTVIHNVIAAMQSRYATSLSPYTQQLLVDGDSISSSFDSAGSQSYPVYIYVQKFFDNVQVDDIAISGWTASDAYVNRADWSASRRSDIPADALLFLGTNDIASSDTLSGETVWTSYLRPLIVYLDGLTSPSIRDIYVMTMLPRGAVASGTAATMEAKRVGRDTSGNALSDWQAAHSYSAATPDFIVHSCGGVNTLFRVTTGGTSDGTIPAGLNSSCSDGSAISEVGAVRWKSYGRPYNDEINDATNQSTYHFISVDIGDPTTPLGNFANTSSLTYYLADKIHPNQAYSTGQADATNPTGPPFANSILAKLYPIFKQQGTGSGRVYTPTLAFAVSPSVGYKGGGVAITTTAREFGEPATSHPLTLGGSDCTSVARVSDVKVLASTPSTTRGSQTLTWTRVDGVTASATYTAVDARFDSISPSSGSIDGGAGPITITGAGFTNGVSSVTIAGTSQSFTTTDDTHLSIPSLAATGSVSGAGGSDVVITMTSGDIITGTGKFFYLPTGISKHVRGDYGLTASTWSDFSGHSRDFVQATGARQGTVVTADAKLGINVLKFTVAGDTVYTTGGSGAAGYTFGTTNSSVVVVGRFWNGQPTGTDTLFQNPAAAAAVHHEASNAWAFYDGSFVANNVGTIGVTNSPHMTICVNNATSGDFYLDGANTHGASTPSASFGAPALGSAVGVTTRNSGTGFPSADFIFGEVIEFSAHALSAGEVTTLGQYRTWMYGFNVTATEPSAGVAALGLVAIGAALLRRRRSENDNAERRAA